MSNGILFTGSTGRSLKKTLKKIITDDSDGYASPAKSQYKQWCKESDMADNWVDELEMGGPGLLALKPEGQEIQAGTINEGTTTRYIASTYAKRITVSDEALEDQKYEKVIDAARRLKRVAWKTVDINAHQMLNNGFDVTKPGGDGLPLWSTAHTLPGGGTFSNLGASAAPSVAALTAVISQMRKMVGHDGIAEGYAPTKVLSPTEQWGDWAEILKSEKEPVNDNFARINAVKSEYGGLTSVSLKFWDTTATDWAVQTDVDDQMQVLWRRHYKSRTWVDNGGMNMQYAISGRFDTGWSDPRNSIGVDA